PCAVSCAAGDALGGEQRGDAMPRARAVAELERRQIVVSRSGVVDVSDLEAARHRGLRAAALGPAQRASAPEELLAVGGAEDAHGGAAAAAELSREPLAL